MKPQKNEQVHWMAQLAMELGWESAERLELRVGTPVEEAWGQVVTRCVVPPEVLAQHIATHFDLPVADLASVDPNAAKLVPEKIARRLGVIPIRQDDRRLVVATADPTSLGLEEDIAFASGRSAQLEIAPPDTILDLQAEYYGGTAGALAAKLDEGLTRAVEVLEESGPETVDASEVESAPIIQLTNFILSDAVKQRASDIHIEPGRGEGAVRIRVDGVMRTMLQLPMAALNRVITRIKIMGKMDIADRLRPQDGRARIQVESRAMELRISTVPTREAEKCVIRLLDHTTAPTLADLDLRTTDRVRVERLLSRRNGIVVVTGPTGSGKTTTLYAAISHLATGELNIMTVENPVEYEMPGITQIQVEPKQKVTFPSALRAILRQDPDVILIGEIRDAETAAIAIQASMTGHLVLATLHTNDAVSAIERLLDLGLERSALAAAFRGVVAQRLVRRLCESCAEPVNGELTIEEQRLSERFGTKPTRRAVGCAACGKTGYFGRIALLEVLIAMPSLAALISGGYGRADLEGAAKQGGMQGLLFHGLERVAEGGTTLQEIARVLGGEMAEPVAPQGLPLSRSTPLPALWEERSGSVAAGPAKFLVVDDDRVHRKAARRMLEAAGFVVDEAADGEAALQMLRSGARYALAILDYTMPEMDGLEVLRTLRSDPAISALSVVVATAEEDPELETRLMNEGADDYIRKPLDAERFTARVKAALRRAKV